MTTDPQPERKQPSRFRGLIVLLTVLTIVGLAIADFARDGTVAKELVGALVFIALTFGGYGADRFFERFKP